MARKIRPIPELTEKDKARFWAKVDVRGPDECWEWSGGKLTPRNEVFGYGVFKVKGSSYLAHRVAFTVTYGLIPEGCLHSCDNPPCCNPRHLFLGSQKDNVTDMNEKGRGNHPRGEEHPYRKNPWMVKRGSQASASKIKESQALDIIARRKNGESLKDISKHHEISKAQASKIARGDSWCHLQQ